MYEGGRKYNKIMILKTMTSLIGDNIYILFLEILIKELQVMVIGI